MISLKASLFSYPSRDLGFDLGLTMKLYLILIQRNSIVIELRVKKVLTHLDVVYESTVTHKRLIISLKDHWYPHNTGPGIYVHISALS